jgi:AbrB family looped-hinge helix DNA binding protein
MMTHAAKSTTTLSAKGQVILPAAIRRRHNWRAGTRLTVEETADGVLLRPAPAFPSTTTEQVFGCLHYEGEPKTLDEMRDGITAEVRRRSARGRYIPVGMSPMTVLDPN